MRTSALLAAVASLLLLSFSAQAGRLSLAVLQFPDPRDPAEMAAALQKVDLLKITDSDRTETSVPALRGGYVIFTQTFGITPGGNFDSSTRLSNQRADVSGSLIGSNLTVQITTLEGVKVGVRKYRESTYSGSGSLASGTPQLISVSQRKNKSQLIVKNRSQVITYESTTIVVAQYTP